MPEWWTYTLSDFQQFSTRTYYRLFELHNGALWPAHVLAFAIGVAILTMLRRPTVKRSRVVFALLAACWLFVAIAFHVARYATINRLAAYFAAAFVLEGLLLVWSGVARPKLQLEIGRAGLVIFVFALLAQPLLGLLFGREWPQLETFGIAPDPTAVATLGVLVAAKGRARWVLLAIPILWCFVSGATLAAMRTPGAWLSPLAGVLALAMTRRRIAGSSASKHPED